MNLAQKVHLYLPVIGVYCASMIMSILLTNTLSSSFNTHSAMSYFMGVFFIIFGGLKAYDVPGFAKRFTTYDVIALRFKAYAYVYPFIELGLGLAFILAPHNQLILYPTLVLGLIGLYSVHSSLVKGERLYCACLGTLFKLPLSYVAFFESLTMVVMAVGMLAVSL